MKGGLGTCVAELQMEPAGKAEPVLVGALVVVNSLGDVVDPWSGQIVAGAYDRSRKAFIGPGAGQNGMDAGRVAGEAGMNTTVAVVATDASLDKEGANKVAQMAQNGLARAIIPAHTMYDGDTVFCLSTAEKPFRATGQGILPLSGRLPPKRLRRRWSGRSRWQAPFRGVQP